jgi:hypothetical protein
MDFSDARDTIFVFDLDDTFWPIKSHPLLDQLREDYKNLPKSEKVKIGGFFGHPMSLIGTPYDSMLDIINSLDDSNVITFVTGRPIAVRNNILELLKKYISKDFHLRCKPSYAINPITSTLLNATKTTRNQTLAHKAVSVLNLQRTYKHTKIIHLDDDPEVFIHCAEAIKESNLDSLTYTPYLVDHSKEPWK